MTMNGSTPYGTRRPPVQTLARVGVAAVTAVVLVGANAPASSALSGAAASDVTCTGTLSDVTVRNVTVPDGATCSIDNASVQGALTVGNATLSITNSRLRSGISPSSSLPATSARATVSMSASRVDGLLRLAFMNSTIIDSRVGPILADGFAEVTTLHRSTVMGGITSSGYHGMVRIHDSTIRGALEVTGGMSTEITGSQVKGTVSLSEYGTLACGSTFGDDVTINSGMGSTYGDGDSCAGNTFRGDLSIDIGIWGVSFFNNTVRGKTTSPASKPTDVAEVTGSGNRFRGEVTGLLATPSFATAA